jgi:hydrogenase nickel incorporation protein HypA/HybF
MRRWEAMHEWALAEAVLETVRERVIRDGGESVASVTVAFGELQHIDRDIFSEGLKTLSGEYGIGSDVFSMETEPALFHCNGCDHEWGLGESGELSEDDLEAIHFLPETVHIFVKCPVCNSTDFLIKRGRGVSITEIRTEDDAHD